MGKRPADKPGSTRRLPIRESSLETEAAVMTSSIPPPYVPSQKRASRTNRPRMFDDAFPVLAPSLLFYRL
ncbi:hypothetical protein BDW62DRAFT_150227 [Aspergillus aurantiobrunneus]